MLRGNIGKPGAGICPVRGHSNVQGQRTVGISEKTKLVPLDKLAELYDFDPPREDGLSTVDACRAMIERQVKGSVSLGGKFLRAVPERGLMEEAWSRMRLLVQIATKLNRSHIVAAEMTYLLPCLGRIEIDQQAGGPQAVSVEDERLFKPGGFARPLAARRRSWKTPNGKANFTVPRHLSSNDAPGPGVLELITLRADGQFNTTIYNESERSMRAEWWS